MKKIGKNQFIKTENVNGAYVFEKEGKVKVCFQMKQGEPIFSEAFENAALSEAFILTL